MNYYEHHIGDYARDTTTLSALEHGVYRLLLDFYYTKEHALPAALDKVYKAAKASSKAERAAVDGVLAEFFTLTPEGFSHKTCDAVIEKFHAAQAEASVKDEEKKTNDKERQARARARRKELFSLLRAHGVVPPYDTKNADLETMLSRVTPPDASKVVTPPVTRDNTASQKPVTSNQSPSSIPEEPDGSLSTSGKSPKVAELQKVIDGIPSGLKYTAPDCPHQKIRDLFSQILPEATEHTTWEGNRVVMLRARWKALANEHKWPNEEAGLVWLTRFFKYFRLSDFLMGRVPPRDGHKQFELSLAWVVNATNWAKIRDGFYHKPKEK
ncbi:DUF1376 domain-containing protein [Polaromonas sp.]|uniref:YdaU family protein n=1 Tax=Polaromonas sp. TaxID=1869339 RepID=UPI003267BAA6